MTVPSAPTTVIGLRAGQPAPDALAAATVRSGALRVLQLGDASHHLGKAAFTLPRWPVAAGPSIYLAGHTVERQYWSTTEVMRAPTPFVLRPLFFFGGTLT